MTPALYSSSANLDLAGDWSPNLRSGKIKQRIQALIDRYLTLEHPQVRSWHPLDWKGISAQQVVGIKREVFLAILVGAIDTEAPIRDYTQTSRQYLESLHPPLAQFVGGTIAPDGSLLEPGLWEKEERRHTPALIRIYVQLTGEKPLPNPHHVRPYQPTGEPRTALFRHGLHRIATEYGATCLYLWLMAHTTGSLQRVLAELLLDEINHMTKFWGFGCWAFPEASIAQTGWMLLLTSRARLTYSRDRSSLLGTLQRLAQALAWPAWSWSNQRTFAITCIRILQRMQDWLQTLTRQELQNLFETH